jgi:hypothetical protein
MRKIAGRWSQCEISARRSCHGLDVLDGFHPSDLGAGKSCWLSSRATGTLPVIVQSLECCWTLFCLGMTFSENRIPLLGIMPHAGKRNAPAPGNRMIKSENRNRFSETMRKNARNRRA